MSVTEKIVVAKMIQKTIINFEVMTFSVTSKFTSKSLDFIDAFENKELWNISFILKN